MSAALPGLFQRDGWIFQPTSHALSPWGPSMLHGGACSGLLTYCLEQSLPDPNFHLLRITHDLFRPVPNGPLEARCTILRHGKRICVIEVCLLSERKEVARSTGLAAIPADVDMPNNLPRKQGPPHKPDDFASMRFGAMWKNEANPMPGLNSLVEMRLVEGMKFTGTGAAWMRVHACIIENEAPSALGMFGPITDFGNGLAQVYLGNGIGMINADIDIHLWRYPQGDWFFLESVNYVNDHGNGLINTNLSDAQGWIGQVSQIVVSRKFTGAT